MKGVLHALHLATLLSNGEVPLDEVTKGDVEMNGVGLTVVEELLLNGNPGMVSSAAALADDVLYLDGMLIKASLKCCLGAKACPEP
jgi:hypothetical protein